jgi:hypothetical protein
MGFPASFADWTDQHKQAYFVGDDPVTDIQVDTDQLEAVAMADAPDEGGEALA